jgi:hypothetical protein
MSAVTEALKEVYSQMDSSGHFPVHPCHGCGTPLCGWDGPRPAETYAGTYTGLCYSCERAGPHVVEELPDGTQRISYPPHCPSWRRAREEFWARPGCEECDGTGRLRVWRQDSEGGSYYRFCATCIRRVSDVRLHNELTYLRDVRAQLAARELCGDPLAACKTAAIESTMHAHARWAQEPQAWRPFLRCPLVAIERRIKPSDLKLKRATTLRDRFIRALDAEIAEREHTPVRLPAATNTHATTRTR